MRGELPQSKYKGNTNTLKNLRLQVKISVSKLIFPLFLTSSLGHPIKGLTEVTREASSAHCDSKAFLIRLYHPEVGL